MFSQKKIIFIFSFLVFSQTILAQNPTIISDSLIVQQRLHAKEKLVVDQEAKFKQDVIIQGDARIKSDLKVDSTFRVDGNARFNGNVRMEGIGHSTELSPETEVIIILPNGQLKKTPINALMVSNATYAELNYCFANGGVPQWWAGTNVLFSPCPDVKVGIGLITPQHKLHVVGSTYSQNYLAGNVEGNTNALYNGYANNSSQDLIDLGVKIGSQPIENRFRIKNDGTLFAKEIRIRPVSDFPDYVFDETYSLMSLKDLANFIALNHHLPNMPTAAEVKANGMAMGELTMKIIEKIEELTLHCIALNIENESLKEELRTQSQQINELREEINSIKEQLKK